MQRRIREACAGGNDEGGLLGGVVEANEKCLVGKEPAKHCVEEAPTGERRNGQAAGCWHAAARAGASKADVQSQLAKRVQVGSRLRWMTPRFAKASPFRAGTSRSTAVPESSSAAHANSIESAWAIVRRAWNGIHHHWTAKNSHRFISEITFRPSAGNCEVSTIDRIDAILDGAVGRRLTYEELKA